MTDPQYKPGDIVNGHRLTAKTDGSLEWLPVEAGSPLGSAEPSQPASGRERSPGGDHKPGDVVNGHILKQLADGSMQWVPMEPQRNSGISGRRLGIAIGAAAGVLLLIVIIVGSVNRPGDVQPVADNNGLTPGQIAEREAASSSEPEAEPEPEMVEIPSAAIGVTAAEANLTLTLLGLEATYEGDASDKVIGLTPGPGNLVEEGSTVILTLEKLTLAQENALRQAQQYLDFMPFSRQGLIDQMSSEYGSGYPVDVATWAVDYLAPDWNAEAAEAAKQYLDSMAFSRDGLYEQLTSPYGSQFTPEQANAGLAAVGY